MSNPLTSKQGWHGRFYEDFEIGDVYQIPSGRTVTTTDNLSFTLLTQIPPPFISITTMRHKPILASRSLTRPLLSHSSPARA